ncbi:MAG TPA: TatD family hydrolase [Bacteroidota bacterium]|nr:TatD family hydrolase [Bacteroidota bacterium]
MYIDSHAHLFYEDYRDDLQAVIERARSAGVEAIVVPGTTLATSQEAVDLAQRFDDVYACVGFHPHEASKAGDNELAAIEQLSHHRRVVAIGEIGLDFHYDFSPREIQESVFQKQIEIAIRRNLPIVVHTRESMAQAIEIVHHAVQTHPEWRQDSSNGNRWRGVFHCFTGTVNEAKQLFELGFLVSYPGIVTFKNSPVLETLKTIGFQHILLETDSPYLAPVPFRGKRNEPANVVYVAHRIAELFGVAPSEIASVAANNTRKLFNLR